MAKKDLDPIKKVFEAIRGNYPLLNTLLRQQHETTHARCVFTRNLPRLFQMHDLVKYDNTKGMISKIEQVSDAELEDLLLNAMIDHDVVSPSLEVVMASPGQSICIQKSVDDVMIAIALTLLAIDKLDQEHPLPTDERSHVVPAVFLDAGLGENTIACMTELITLYEESRVHKTYDYQSTKKILNETLKSVPVSVIEAELSEAVSHYTQEKNDWRQHITLSAIDEVLAAHQISSHLQHIKVLNRIEQMH